MKPVGQESIVQKIAQCGFNVLGVLMLRVTCGQHVLIQQQVIMFQENTHQVRINVRLATTASQEVYSLKNVLLVKLVYLVLLIFKVVLMLHLVNTDYHLHIMEL